MMHLAAFEARHSAQDNNLVEIFDFDLILLRNISQPPSRVNLRPRGCEKLAGMCVDVIGRTRSSASLPHLSQGSPSHWQAPRYETSRR